MKKPKYKKCSTLLAMLALSSPIVAHADLQNYITETISTSLQTFIPSYSHLQWDIPVTAGDCGADLNQSGKVYALVEDLVCSSDDTGGEPQALLLSANNSKLFLNHHFIRFKYTVPGGDVDLDGIVVTDNNNLVEGHGVVGLFRNNLIIREANGNRITGLTIKSSDQDGVQLFNASKNKILKNKILDSRSEGVKLINSNMNTIADNNIFNTRNHSIELEVNAAMTTSNNLITHNLLELTDNEGINFDNLAPGDEHLMNDNTISYNTIISVEGEGISLDSGDRNIIEHNEISNTADEGIEIRDAIGTLVRYNTITKTAADGIKLNSNTSKSIITHNDITNSRIAGILFDGSGNLNGNEITDNHIQKSGQSGILLVANGSPSSVTENVIIGNHISKSFRQAISLLDEDQGGASNEISGNTISDNEAKHDLTASAAYSDCTLAGDFNTWGTNDANNIQITPPDPGCELT